MYCVRRAISAIKNSKYTTNAATTGIDTLGVGGGGGGGGGSSCTPQAKLTH